MIENIVKERLNDKLSISKRVGNLIVDTALTVVAHETSKGLNNIPDFILSKIRPSGQTITAQQLALMEAIQNHLQLFPNRAEISYFASMAIMGISAIAYFQVLVNFLYIGIQNNRNANGKLL